MKTIKRIYHFILSTKHPVADFIWQLDSDIDELNAFIINAEKEIKK